MTRSITVEASGEVAALKDNINEMIQNLKDQTLKNTEQDWLKTNLTRFTRMLQGDTTGHRLEHGALRTRAARQSAAQPVYVTEKDEENHVALNLVASYAFNHRKHLANRFELREGLVGQCAFKNRVSCSPTCRMTISRWTRGWVRRGLNVIVLPVVFEGEVNADIELASFSEFSETHQSFLDQLMESIGIVLNTIAANMRTEGLLKQSQLLTAELQARQKLKKTNDRAAAGQYAPPVRRTAALQAGRVAAHQRRSSRTRRNCSPSQTRRSKPRTARSKTPSVNSRKKPSSSP